MTGPLAVSALGLLLERPMHPYETVQLLLARWEDRLVKVPPDSLYHVVDRLAGLRVDLPLIRRLLAAAIDHLTTLADRMAAGDLAWLEPPAVEPPGVP